MPVWTKGGLRFASRRFLVHNMISSWSIPLSTGHSKPPQEPLRSCSCFVEAQMRIKKNVKVGKKNTKTSDQTHSDKPAFSLPAVPLQDKSFYSATSKGSVLAEPHTSSLSLAWLSFGWFPAALWEHWPAQHLHHFGEDLSPICPGGCPWDRVNRQYTTTRHL